jgi:dihydropyrimidinase
VASDHSAWSLEQKRTGGALDFAQTPNGAPGIENRLDLLYEYGVRRGTLTMQQFVAMTSTTSAKLFGLYPQKGTIAVGSDADLVIWGTDRRRALSADTHHSRAGFSLYDGIEVTGQADVVMVRGTVVIEDGRLVAEPGLGEFVKRARYGRQLVRGETVTA